MSKKEIYVSIDIESDGPIPFQNSMLSLGAAAFDGDGRLLGRFETNFELLPDAVQDPSTMKFWSENQAAWDATRIRTKAPHECMHDFNSWVTNLLADDVVPVAVCYPSGFDWTFVHCYFMKFVGSNPFGFSCIDVRSYIMGLNGVPHKKTSKRNWPNRWFTDLPHTHIASDDAIEQGLQFMKIKADSEGGRTRIAEVVKNFNGTKGKV